MAKFWKISQKGGYQKFVGKLSTYICEINLKKGKPEGKIPFEFVFLSYCSLSGGSFNSTPKFCCFIFILQAPFTVFILSLFEGQKKLNF